jgi:hypothetical protein
MVAPVTRFQYFDQPGVFNSDDPVKAAIPQKISRSAQVHLP